MSVQNYFKANHKAANDKESKKYLQVDDQNMALQQ